MQQLQAIAAPSYQLSQVLHGLHPATAKELARPLAGQALLDVLKQHAHKPVAGL
jgi:hypothetical protein